MENVDKGLTVTKSMLMNWPKVPKMPQTLSAQIVCPSPKVWDFNETSFIGYPYFEPKKKSSYKVPTVPQWPLLGVFVQ